MGHAGKHRYKIKREVRLFAVNENYAIIKVVADFDTNRGRKKRRVVGI